MNLETYVLGSTLLILYHELAHGLIEAGGLPSLGREEDAADDFALVELVTRIQAAHNDQEEQEKLAAFGYAFVDQWLKSSIEDGTLNVRDYFGEHALNLQRHFNSACLLYGGSTDVFGEIIKTFDLGEQMLSRCRDLYFAAYDGWSYTLNDFGLFEENDNASAIKADDDLILEYLPAKREQHRRWQELAEGSGEFEKMQSNFSQTFKLPNPIRVTFESCGEENAFYYPESNSVSICYEIMNAFARHHGRDTQNALGQRP